MLKFEIFQMLKLTPPWPMPPNRNISPWTSSREFPRCPFGNAGPIVSKKGEKVRIFYVGQVAHKQIKTCFFARTTDSQWSLFALKSRTFGLGQTNWADKFRCIWVIFGQTISTHFGTVSPCHYFYKKLSLYIHIPNIYLGLGFEFGP